MSVNIIDGSGTMVTAKITGELSKADVSQIQAIAREAIQRNGKITALFFLEQFRGWKTEPGWGDLTFLNEHDKNIAKIAVVGEARWKDDVCAFLAKGFRSAAVEYFLASEPYKARQWLKASSIKT
jgi:SpoIIAA-like